VILSLVFIFWWRPDKGIKNQEFAGESEKVLPTKSHRRESESEKDRRAKKPREEFDEARKRGLSEDEVRGIVEEYFKVVTYKDQPERPLEEIMNELRLARLRLYLDVLSEGLHLSQEQIAIVEEQLPSLASKEVVRIILLAQVDAEWALPVAPENAVVAKSGSSGLSRLQQIETAAKTSLFSEIPSEIARPWELCELSEDQKQLLGYEDDTGEWIWVDGEERTLDYYTEKCYDHLDDPFAQSQVMHRAGVVFPLSMWQVERLGDFEDVHVAPFNPMMKEGGELDRVKFLTRAQLQTLLLFNHDIAEGLKRELGD